MIHPDQFFIEIYSADGSIHWGTVDRLFSLYYNLVENGVSMLSFESPHVDRLWLNRNARLAVFRRDRRD